MDKVHLSGSEAINLTLTITNTGTVPGEEIVQLYIQDLYGSSVRPVKELKGFRKVRLNAGESKVVRFTITEADLKYYLADGSYKAEPGEFKVYVGTNSRDVQESKFELVK